MNKVMLRIENLIKKYPKSVHTSDAFRLNINHLEFNCGKIYSLVGPNGAGKTTLVNILGLLDFTYSGKIFFDNIEVLNKNILSTRREMVTVMENPYIFSDSVRANLILGYRLRRINQKIPRGKISAALGEVGLDGFDVRSARSLSKGQAQRLAIARAIILKTKVLLLDEPFTNIDRKSVALIENLITRIRNEHKITVIFTTHDLLQAWRLSDSVISLVDGKIVDSPLDNLFSGMVEEKNGVEFIRLSNNLTVVVTTGRRGKANISIPPQDIILSKSPFESSARNCFTGVIRKVYIKDGIVRVNVFIGNEVEFITLITRNSYNKMNLSIEDSIFLAFKATSVKIF